MARLYQGAFNSGELAPGMWGRVDLERYGSGLRVLRNMFPLAEGGLAKRPGLEFVGFSVESAAADGRLIPFKFNNEQTYMLVAQPNTLYFCKNGGVIIEDIDAYGGAGAASVASDATGTKVTYTTHGYSAGDVLFWVEGGFEELRGRWVKVAAAPAPGANDFYVLDIATGDHIDSSGYTSDATTIDFGKIYSLDNSDGWFDDGGGGGSYADVPVGELDYTQANDKLYVAHPSGPTKIITRTGDTAWTIENFDAAPAIGTPTTLAASAKPADAGLSVWYAVTAIDPVTYEESIAAVLEVTDTDNPTSGDPITLTWDEQTSESVEQFRIYKGVSGIYGLIGTAADPNPGTGGDSLSFSDEGITPNLAIAPPLSADFFNASDEYPGAVELFQQRIWFGRSNNLLRDIYASRSGGFNFATSTVSVDDDPIEQAISAKSVQEVKHFVPLKDLVVLTSDAEWSFDKGDAGVITPSAGLVAQSFWGTAGVKPVIVGESAIFVEKTGRSIRDLAYALQNDGFASSNISIFASHLFRGRTVVSMCFAQSPYNTLFCVMSDGQAVSCTYVRDQQIFAWARHDTRGRMLDCASVTEDGRDNIYVYVERGNESATSLTDIYRQIERMQMIDPANLDLGVWLDNSMDTNAPTSASASEVHGVRVKEYSGVDRLQVLGVGASIPYPDRNFRMYVPAGSPLEPLRGMVLQVEDTSPLESLGVYRWKEVYRTFDGSTLEQVDPALLFPSGLYVIGSGLAYFDNPVSGLETEVKKAHHLAYRGAKVTVRADNDEYSNVTIPDGGIYEFNASKGAALIHVGETYTAEFETLDIDSVQDPITGRTLSISNILLRFTMAMAFYVGRRRANLAPVTNTMLYAEEDWSPELGGFRGVFNVLPFPEIREDGRIVVRSRDAFPFQVAAIILNVEAGDED